MHSATLFSSFSFHFHSTITSSPDLSLWIGNFEENIEKVSYSSFRPENVLDSHPGLFFLIEVVFQFVHVKFLKVELTSQIGIFLLPLCIHQARIDSHSTSCSGQVHPDLSPIQHSGNDFELIIEKYETISVFLYYRQLLIAIGSY